MSVSREQEGISWLEHVLKFQGLTTSVTSHLVEDASGSSCWLTIDEANLSEVETESLIGDRGNVLDSIQYLANTLLNLGKAESDQQAYTIELAGYRARRRQELEALAAHAAEEARASGQEFEITSLSSAERRQVHHFLNASYEGLETFSRGKEPDRRLVVRLAQPDNADDEP